MAILMTEILDTVSVIRIEACVGQFDEPDGFLVSAMSDSIVSEFDQRLTTATRTMVRLAPPVIHGIARHYCLLR